MLADLGAAGVAAALGACSNREGDSGGGTPSPAQPSSTSTATLGPSPSPTATLSPSPSPTPAEDVPLEVAAGEMLMVGFRGVSIDAAHPFATDLQQLHVGSTILFEQDVASGAPGRNIVDPTQLATLCASLQGLVAPGPLFIATDQEGGAVRRLLPEDGFPELPAAADIGASGDAGYAYDLALETGAALAAAGINLNLAPVVDLNTNPENPIIGALGRSYSADPSVVTAMAHATIQGYHDAGILTALKHFPGHGSSTGDSHEGFVDVTQTWSAVELDPYRTLIGEGVADVVMVAHVFNAELDAAYPASLSPATVTGLLRDELGFEGVVMTDDLQMGAIAGLYGFDEAIRLAVEAGNDILGFGNNLDFDPGLGAKAHASLLALVEDGVVPAERLRQSYERIRRLKQRIA